MPTTTDKMLIEVHKNIMSKVEELTESQDEAYVGNMISVMDEATLLTIKEFYGGVTLGEQTAWKLSRFFVKEVRDL